MGSPETCPVCEDFAAACRHPAHYATPPAPADDASGAEAMREACAKLCDEVANEIDAVLIEDGTEGRAESSVDAVRTIIRERDAYKRAKAENDERYMIERDAATARADKAEALLREARVGLDQCACCGWSELVARIDAALEEKK